MALSLLAGPRTDSAADARMTARIRIKSGHGISQAIPNMRVERQANRTSQRRTAHSIGGRLRKNHARKLPAAHADGPHRSILTRARGNSHIDRVHNMKYRNPRDD